jgi:hypothetical protein
MTSREVIDRYEAEVLRWAALIIRHRAQRPFAAQFIARTLELTADRIWIRPDVPPGENMSRFFEDCPPSPPPPHVDESIITTIEAGEGGRRRRRKRKRRGS